MAITPEQIALEKIKACALQNCPNLSFVGLGLKQLTTEIAQLKNLSKLLLSSNQLSELPLEIGQLIKLFELDLERNGLSKLPSSIRELKKLNILYLSSNQLTELPAEIGQIKELSILNLNSNILTQLPETIGQLQNLSKLDLSKNQLKELPLDIGQLKNLSRLYLSSNQLSKLPPSIGKLKNLSEIYLNYNQLNDLPATIGQMQKLSKLDLNSNNISKLPPTIGQLKNLSELYIFSNKLTELPAEIGQLKKLSRLDLSYNQLTTLPTEILQLGLKITCESGLNFRDGEITLKDNPLIDPPIEIVQQGNKAIAAYFSEAGKDKRPLNEVKVLLVGDGGAGKTSLLRRLVGQNFDPKESQTHGINIKHYPINTSQRDVTLNYWDFGGQEIMHHTHQFFLSKRSLYILVLDGRKEEEPEYWLDYIQTLGGDSPVLVALNKIDQHPSFEINRADLRRKYTNIYDFFRISCKENIEIEALRKELYNAIFKVEMLETMWPSSWFKVKQVLEQLKQPFINETTYIELCKNNEVIDEVAQDTLVEFLDQLGIVLHFKELSLRDVHVLQPHWVTEAVYRIINHKILAEAKGVLSLDDLPALLKKPENSLYEYPRNIYYYIITLMKQFELCYELNSKQRLVPDLLPIEESKFEFNEDNVLRFIFIYQFLPRSIMPRFIVKSHENIKNDWQWRTGVVLYDDKTGATAVVRSDKKNRKIEIMVNGKQKRDYFAVIRNTLWEIHRSFEVDKLGIEERIPLPGHPEYTAKYKELVGLEKMGEEFIIVGELGKKFSVAAMLNGIEKPTSRQVEPREQGDSYVQHFYGDSHVNQGRDNMNSTKTNKVGNITVSGNNNQLAEIGGDVGGNITQTNQTLTSNPQQQELQTLVNQLKAAIENADIDPAQKAALQSQFPILEQAQDLQSIQNALNLIQTIAATLDKATHIMDITQKITRFVTTATGLFTN